MSYPWVKEPGSQVQVAVAAVEARIRDLPHEITDEQIERDKAGNRGVFMAEFRKILADCDRGDPDDPRWHELRLRCLKEMARLTRVYEADAPTQKQGPGNPRDLANAAAADLVQLEESLRETRGPSAD